MGTNYYLYNKPDCPCCGRAYEPLHIGKSSGGWCFSLHVIPEQGINDLDDWHKLWTAEGAVIKDEYGRSLTPEEMEDYITNRYFPRESGWTAEEYRRNHAQRGPNNLARHVIDGRHCIGHGGGTWDLITGNFS